MAYTYNITGDCPTELTVYYTNTAKKYFLNSETGDELKIKSFGVSDSDINYAVQKYSKLSEGELADISGDRDDCLSSLSECIFEKPSLKYTQDSCLTQNMILSIIENNGYKKDVVVENNQLLNIDNPNINYEGFIKVDENFDLENDYGNSFASKYEYMTIQEMYYDIGRKQLEGKSLPFLCDYETIFCSKSGDTAPDVTKQCGESLFSTIGLTPIENRFSLPSSKSGYVIVSWNFGTSGDRVIIERDNVTFDTGNSPPYYQGAGSYTYFYNAGINNNYIDVTVEPKVFQNSDWVLTVNCPTPLTFTSGDTILVSPSQNSSRAYIVNIPKKNQLLKTTYTFDIESDESYSVSMFHNNQRIASTNGYITHNGEITHNYTYQNGDDNYIVVLVQKGGNEKINSGDVVLKMNSTIL